MLQQSGISVMARRWDSTRSRFSIVVPGATLESIVLDAIQGMRREGQYTRAQARLLARYARCRVDGIEIKRSQWADTRPHEGARLEILQGVKGGGGGGGGKNPVATVLSVVVMVAAMAAGPWIAGPAILGLTGTTAAIVGGAITTGIMVGGMLAVNALFPSAAPSLGSIGGYDAAKDSPTYSITGARNAANVNGYIPLVCGKHRHTPPLGAKSWTKWEGDKQFFHMLVVWGHPDVEVTDFRIGKTPLSDFKHVKHVFHQASYGNDLELFAKSYDEKSVGSSLKASDGWVTRRIGECEDISVDIAFNALCTLDKKTGEPRTRAVQFQMQHALVGSDDWKNFGGTTVSIRAAQRTVGDYPPGIEIRASMDGTVEFGWVSWQPVDAAAYPIELWPNKNPHVVGCDVTFSGATASVTPGVYQNNDSVIASGAKRSSVVRNFRVEGLARAKRQVRVRRLTGDSGSQYILDEAVWSTSRAILNQPAFNTRLPYCVSELRIQASEQLSSFVDDFNALCHSKIPDWDADTQSWITRTTSNPASIFRYLLTSPHGLVRPYTTAKMDDASIIAFHAFCKANGYEFNFILDAEQTTWARLVQVLAAGRAAPTTDVDGLWGVVIDRSGKQVKQLFTPRNSWGMSVQRGFVDLPHALRVSFVDETDDYTTQENYVFADGYSNDGAKGTEPATDVVEWDYPGVTKWEKVWRMGRYHLAKLLHRPMSVTINTDWEWLVCHRGDLVGIASDVLMNTFGTARIQRLLYDVDGVETLVGREQDIPTDEYGQPLIPIGVQLDDTVMFQEPAPARYGIAIRDRKGGVTTYELVPEYGDEEHSVLYFMHPVPAQAVPPLYGLCSVSLLGQEYEEYLLAAVQPGDNASAELTLIPYAAEEIEAAAEGEIPPYAPPIILDVTKGSSLPTPIIIDVRSDESVLIRASSGGTTPRIAAWWALSVSTEAATNLNFQIMATDVLTGVNFFGSATSLEDFVAAAGVEEGRLYDVRVRALDPATGKTSAWSAPIRHAVIGRTTPPPAPDAVNLDGYTLRISQSNRPLDVVGHVVTMVFDETDSINMGRVLTDPYTTTGTFDLTPWAGRARRVFVQTVDELGLLSDAVSIAINLGDVLPDNVLFTISERERGWPGTMVNAYVDGSILRTEETAFLWPQDDDAPLWPQDDSFPLWNSGAGLQMSYVWQVTAPAAYAGARVMVNPVATSGKLISIEYRQFVEPLLWPQDDSAYLWPQDDAAHLWPQPTYTEWQAFPENYVTHGYETLEFRVVYAAGEPAALADIEVLLDVADKEWTLEDFEIDASGTTHLPLPLNTFRSVTNVVAHLQYRTGDTAITTMRVPGSEVMGENGYLELGPIILALDDKRTSTAASADVRIKGY